MLRPLPQPASRMRAPLGQPQPGDHALEHGASPSIPPVAILGLVGLQLVVPIHAGPHLFLKVASRAVRPPSRRAQEASRGSLGSRTARPLRPAPDSHGASLAGSIATAAWLLEPGGATCSGAAKAVLSGKVSKPRAAHRALVAPSPGSLHSSSASPFGPGRERFEQRIAGGRSDRRRRRRSRAGRSRRVRITQRSSARPAQASITLSELRRTSCGEALGVGDPVGVAEAARAAWGCRNARRYRSGRGSTRMLPWRSSAQATIARLSSLSSVVRCDSARNARETLEWLQATGCRQPAGEQRAVLYPGRERVGAVVQREREVLRGTDLGWVTHYGARGKAASEVALHAQAHNTAGSGGSDRDIPQIAAREGERGGDARQWAKGSADETLCELSGACTGAASACEQRSARVVRRLRVADPSAGAASPRRF